MFVDRFRFVPDVDAIFGVMGRVWDPWEDVTVGGHGCRLGIGCGDGASGLGTVWAGCKCTPFCVVGVMV